MSIAKINVTVIGHTQRRSLISGQIKARNLLETIEFARKCHRHYIAIRVKLHVLDAGVGESGELPIPMLKVSIVGLIDAVILGVARPKTDKHVARFVGNHIADVMRLAYWVEVGATPSLATVEGEMQALVAVFIFAPNQQSVV